MLEASDDAIDFAYLPHQFYGALFHFQGGMALCLYTFLKRSFILTS
jgi:hypothetical protein